MSGIVQLLPGKCFFLYRYTDCSRTSRVATSTKIEVVQLVSENRAAKFEGAKLASPFPPNEVPATPLKSEEPALA